MDRETALLLILVLMERISKIKNTGIRYFKGEIEIHAPDPDEEGEEEALDILSILYSEIKKSDFECEAFHRGVKVDALRIHLGDNRKT